MAAATAALFALPVNAGATVVVRKAKTVKVTAGAPATLLTMQSRAAGCTKPPRLTLVLKGRRIAHQALRPRKLQHLSFPVVVKHAGTYKVKARLRTGERSCRVRLGLAAFGGPAPAARSKSSPVLPDPMLAPKRAVPLGAAVEWRSLSWQTDSDYHRAFTSNFESLTPENVMKMEYLEPERGEFDFNYADSLVDFAAKNGKEVRGHALVWHQQLPKWITSKRWSRDELNKELELYIKTVVGHYRGRIAEWDVANEVIDNHGNWRESPFYEALGEDFVANAFRWAHEADPGAKLYLNDFDIEFDGVKADKTVALVKKLRAEGVPIHGVGLQMHWDEGAPPAPAEVQRWLRRYADLGVEVQITEMDVAIEPAYNQHPEHLENQAKQYESAAIACNAVVQCTKFTVWGVSDKYTWRGSQTVPLLLTESYARKRAYELVRGAFASR